MPYNFVNRKSSGLDISALNALIDNNTIDVLQKYNFLKSLNEIIINNTGHIFIYNIFYK
jgi:hypothetical protein